MACQMSNISSVQLLKDMYAGDDDMVWKCGQVSSLNMLKWIHFFPFCASQIFSYFSCYMKDYRLKNGRI